MSTIQPTLRSANLRRGRVIKRMNDHVKSCDVCRNSEDRINDCCDAYAELQELLMDLQDDISELNGGRRENTDKGDWTSPEQGGVR